MMIISDFNNFLITLLITNEVLEGKSDRKIIQKLNLKAMNLNNFKINLRQCHMFSLDLEVICCEGEILV